MAAKSDFPIEDSDDQKCSVTAEVDTNVQNEYNLSKPKQQRPSLDILLGHFQIGDSIGKTS